MYGDSTQSLEDAHALKAALPRTWGAFFGRYGNFTPAQLAAIPLILAGENVLLCAPTAGGKTAAVMAPLVERYLPQSPGDLPLGLTILYILPTRALISDLWLRLRVAFETLRVRTTVKTHDLNLFDPQRPSEVLLTTPESLDVLLASYAKLLANVQAVVVDEAHTFSGTVRGDHVRALLSRLRQVRAHAVRKGDAESEQMQYVGLSATLARPQETARQLFGGGHVIQVAGRRTLQAEQIALQSDSPDALISYLNLFRQRGWRKALAFCNTRAEVESYAAAVHDSGTPFGNEVYAHYSNLAWERRREIEQSFGTSQAAICFASSTLELGIDIGDIDITLLIGAPGSLEAYAQRIGRANRRSQTIRTACFYRTPLESVSFSALQA